MMISAGDRRVYRRTFEERLAHLGAPFHPPEGSPLDQPTVQKQNDDFFLLPLPPAFFRRLFAAASSRVAMLLGGMRVSYTDFNVMRSAAGTGFRVKKIRDDTMVIAGSLSAVAEFVYSLHDDDWLNGKYVTLARTMEEIRRLAFRPKHEWHPLDIACDRPAFGIHADVRGNTVTGAIEITFSLPVIRAKGDTWDERLARFQAWHLRRVEDIARESTHNGILAAINGLLHAENGRDANYLRSLLADSTPSSKRIGRNMGEVNVGLSMNQGNEIMALTIRFIETLGGMREGQDINVVEFIGALDPSDPTRRTIIWSARNVASLYRDTDMRYLQPHELMDKVIALFDENIEHKIALRNGNGEPPHGTAQGTSAPAAYGMGIGPLTGGGLAGFATGMTNPLAPTVIAISPLRP